MIGEIDRTCGFSEAFLKEVVFGMKPEERVETNWERDTVMIPYHRKGYQQVKIAYHGRQLVLESKSSNR